MDPAQPTPQPQQQPAPQPVMDVVPPRPAQEPVKMPPKGDDSAPQHTAKPEEKKAEDKPVAPKTARPKQVGVSLAIAATVVIVLGLAAMMVYAYLRANGY